MHNSVGRAVAQLGTFGGTITLADANSIPHGGSPRNQNVDYKVGSVYTRAGLVNPFVFENGSAGPNAGGSVSGSGWSNPNALLNGSGYASAAIDPQTLTVSAVEVVLSSGQYFAVVTFTSAVPAWASGQTYTFSGLTTYTALNGQTLAVYAGSGVPTLTAEQQAFVFGSTAYGPASDTGSGAVSGIWEPTGILELEQFGFSISPTSTPQGFELTVLAYATGAGATLNFQMLKAGTPVGDVRSVPLTTESQQLPLGSINDLFGEAWTYADLNNTAFGVEVWATGTAAVTVYASLVTLQPWFTPEQVNFNYVTTFEDSWGDIYTMALDANGNWWIEDVLVNSPDGTQSGSAVPSSGVAASVTAIPGSVTSIGEGVPWANPAFATARENGGETAAITSYSASASGQTVTFLAANSFTAGQVVRIAGSFPFNNFQGPVLSPSGSQFTLAWDGYDISATSVSATATVQPEYASALEPTVPVSVPSGQCVAWARPTAVSVGTSGQFKCFGTWNVVATSEAQATGTGFLSMYGTCSTGNSPAFAQWSGFAVPDLPVGAVIQGVYPVIISQGNQTNAEHEMQWGVGSLTGSIFPLGSGVYGPSQIGPTSSMGSTSGTITGALIQVSELQSASGDDFPDFDQITFVGLAVYYTTTETCPTGLQALYATDLGLDIPLTATITGISVSLNAGDSGTSSLTAQLTLNGAPVGTSKPVTLGAWPQAQTLGPDLWGAAITPVAANGSAGLGVQFVGAGTIDVNAVTFTVTYTTGPQPPTLLPLETVPHGLFASSFTASSRQYIALSDLLQGDWQPSQFTGNWWDRVSQVGPGAPPQYTPITASGDTFNITSITQPAAKSQGSSYFLQSSGPGSTSPGSVITFYYLDATVAPGPDADLVAAFNSGYPVYVYASFSGTPVAFPATVVQVTAIGEAQPPGQPRK
ncbi:MAG: hypothetical protein RB191_17245, partial [Terriglobia bacterium]|nr:hypothetical protein [Terriglobia bacterium]